MKDTASKAIISQIQDNTQSLISLNLKQDSDIAGLVAKLEEQFDQDECVQVAENYLEQKHVKELQAYLSALFEERARGLRKYIFQLVSQKQSEMELIREELRPQYELLRERKEKGQLKEDCYKEQMDKLAEEESERLLDAELSIKELEQAMEDELLVQHIKGKADVQQAL